MKKTPNKVPQMGSAGPSGSKQGSSAKAYLPSKPVGKKKANKVQSA